MVGESWNFWIGGIVVMFYSTCICQKLCVMIAYLILKRIEKWKRHNFCLSQDYSVVG